MPLNLVLDDKAGSFFHLLMKVGVVSTGVAKALQGVLVFVLSHPLYCKFYSMRYEMARRSLGRQDESQCFSPVKGVSLLIVISGVLAYISATSQRERASWRHCRDAHGM